MKSYLNETNKSQNIHKQKITLEIAIYTVFLELKDKKKTVSKSSIQQE